MSAAVAKHSLTLGVSIGAMTAMFVAFWFWKVKRLGKGGVGPLNELNPDVTTATQAYLLQHRQTRAFRTYGIM